MPLRSCTNTGNIGSCACRGLEYYKVNQTPDDDDEILLLMKDQQHDRHSIRHDRRWGMPAADIEEINLH